MVTAPTSGPISLPRNFTPATNDVICAERNGSHEHPGNKLFNSFIRANARRYEAHAVSGRVVRVEFLRRLLYEIRTQNTGIGRFVQRDWKDRWEQLSDDMAREKIGRAIRLVIRKDTKPLPRGFSPSPNDVICGQRQLQFHHPGNQLFYFFIQANVQRYEAVPAIKNVKTAFVCQLFDEVRAANSGIGRFVQRQVGVDGWEELTDDMTRDKIGRAIRQLISRRKITGNTPCPPLSSAKACLPETAKGSPKKKSPMKGLPKKLPPPPCRPVPAKGLPKILPPPRYELETTNELHQGKVLKDDPSGDCYVPLPCPSSIRSCHSIVDKSGDEDMAVEEHPAKSLSAQSCPYGGAIPSPLFSSSRQGATIELQNLLSQGGWVITEQVHVPVVVLAPSHDGRLVPFVYPVIMLRAKPADSSTRESNNVG